MKLFPLYFFVLFLILPGFTTAGETTLEEVSASESSGYGPENSDGYEGEDEDDDDEDALPENVIAKMYENGRMAFLFGKFDVAFKAWEPLANQGYSKAQASLGWMYHTGNGVTRDIQQAMGWYTLAAEQNHAIAQNNLAVFYENGQGVIPDNKAAFSWYKKSAESGYPYAQYNLGRMYAQGLGTRKNIKEAIYWWRSASRHKVKKATEALAILDNKPEPAKKHSKLKQPVAHAPYHANPVAKGLAWVKKQATNHYTIQLFRSQDLEWILKLAAAEQLPQSITQIQSTDPNGDKWYTLIYGSFPSYQSAEGARKNLPQSLKKWGPKLRRFGEIHQLLKK
jgi:TPR repeat protein